MSGSKINTYPASSNVIATNSSAINFNKFSAAATKHFTEGRLIVKNEEIVASASRASLRWLPFAKKDPREIEENRTAWRVFLASIDKIAGVRSRQRVEKRYNIREKLERGDPLSTKIALATAVFLRDPTTADLKRENKGIKLKRLSSQQLASLIKNHAKKIQIDTSCLPSVDDIYGTPMDDDGYYMHDRAGMDLQMFIFNANLENVGKVKNKQHEKYKKTIGKVGNLPRLAKAIVNFEIDNKTILPVKLGDGQIVNYKVYKRVSGRGLWAYALKPIIDPRITYPYKKDRPPAIIMFRQTQSTPSALDLVDSLKNDCQSRFGTLGYSACCHDLQKLAQDEKFLRGSNLLITGYSLGGNHSQHFIKDYCESKAVKDKLLTDPDFHLEAHIFNAPKLDKDSAIEFAANMNRLPVPDNLPKKAGKIAPKVVLRYYHNSNKYKSSSGQENTITDPAGLVGDLGIGCNVNHPLFKVVEYDIEFATDKKMDMFYLHSERGFDNEKIPYIIKIRKDKQAQAALDNTLLDANLRSWEKLRRTWGSFVSILVTFLVKVVSFVFRPYGFMFRTSPNVELKRPAKSKPSS